MWDSDDDTILFKALDLCRILKERHYYTDTGGMAIRCNECGAISYGEAQASGHASQTGHYVSNHVLGVSFPSADGFMSRRALAVAHKADLRSILTLQLMKHVSELPIFLYEAILTPRF